MHDDKHLHLMNIAVAVGRKNIYSFTERKKLKKMYLQLKMNSEKIISQGF